MIFALGLKGLGPNTKLAGSLLVMAIVGGACFSPGAWVDCEVDGESGEGYIVPLLGFVVVAAYGFLAPRGSRARWGLPLRRIEILLPPDALVRSGIPRAAKAPNFFEGHSIPKAEAWAKDAKTSIVGRRHDLKRVPVKPRPSQLTSGNVSLEVTEAFGGEDFVVGVAGRDRAWCE